MLEDDFVTPSSTPPSETMPVQSLSDLRANSDLSHQALHEKIYEKYILNLSDAHVMIGTSDDNWKNALNKNSSLLHCIDKFTISLQIER